MIGMFLDTHKIDLKKIKSRMIIINHLYLLLYQSRDWHIHHNTPLPSFSDCRHHYFFIMEEEEAAPQPKRKRETPPATMEDFYLFGKAVQQRMGSSLYSMMTEELHFCQFFGIPASAAMAAWDLLIKNEHVPEEGTVLKFLWALYFLKHYPKEGPLCAALGGIDPKTCQKHIWPFIYAIAALEPDVLSKKYQNIDNSKISLIFSSSSCL